MLSKKDLEQIRTIIQEELKEALTVEVQYEKFDKIKGMKELKIEKHFMPAWIMDWQPHLIGALRGLQEDANKTNNKMVKTSEVVDKLKNIMLQTEDSLKCLATFSDRIKEIEHIESVAPQLRHDSKDQSS